MQTRVTIFTPYPFTVGEKIHITQGSRRGDWLVTGLDDKKITLRCPVSGRELTWDRFCYQREDRVQEWPQVNNTEQPQP